MIKIGPYLRELWGIILCARFFETQCIYSASADAAVSFSQLTLTSAALLNQCHHVILNFFSVYCIYSAYFSSDDFSACSCASNVSLIVYAPFFVEYQYPFLLIALAMTSLLVSCWHGLVMGKWLLLETGLY